MTVVLNGTTASRGATTGTAAVVGGVGDLADAAAVREAMSPLVPR